MAKTNNPQEHREPKTVARQTFILSMALTFVFTAMIGTVAGYFIHVNMETDARASVVRDMQLVKENR